MITAYWRNIQTLVYLIGQELKMDLVACEGVAYSGTYYMGIRKRSQAGALAIVSFTKRFDSLSSWQAVFALNSTLVKAVEDVGILKSAYISYASFTEPSMVEKNLLSIKVPTGNILYWDTLKKEFVENAA